MNETRGTNGSWGKDSSAITLPLGFADALLGSEIAQVTGNDVDSGPVLWYALSPSGPQGPFSIGRYGGRVSLTGPLDFEQCDHYHLQLLAHDGPHEGHANLTVLVEDVNDNVPTFSQSLYQVPALSRCPHTWDWGSSCCSNEIEAEVAGLGWMLGLMLEWVESVPF